MRTRRAVRLIRRLTAAIAVAAAGFASGGCVGVPVTAASDERQAPSAHERWPGDLSGQPFGGSS